MQCIDKCVGAAAKGHMELDGKDGDEDEDEESGPLSKAVAAPLTVLFEATIPDCTKPEKKNKYFMTFLMSIFWIGVLSFYMVDWASKLGTCWNPTAV